MRPADRLFGRTRHALLPLAAFGLSTLPHLVPPWTVNHDVAWYLEAAQRWLAGGRLYLDILDVNPPLILYATAIPVALGRALHMPAVLAHDLCVLAAALGSLLLAGRCAAGALRSWPATDRAVLATVVVLVLVGLPGPDFGQREHLLCIAILPWLGAVAARAAGARAPRSAAVAAGLLAGLGIALKPYFLLLPLLVLGVEPRRRIGSESLALVLVLVVYALHFAFLPADVRAGLADMIALARATYWTLDASAAELLAAPWTGEALCLGLGSGMLLLAARSGGSLAGTLALSWLALLLAAWVQHKGWSYHFLPARTLGWLAVASAGLPLAGRIPPRVRAIGLSSLLLAVAAKATLERAPAGGLRLAKANRAWLADAALLARLAGGGSVLALDSNIAPWLPAAHLAGRRWAGHYPCLWALSALHGTADPALLALAARVRGHVASDLEQGPELLCVPRPPQHARAPLADPLAWCLEEPRFAAAFARYTVCHTTATAVLYRRG